MESIEDSETTVSLFEEITGQKPVRFQRTRWDDVVDNIREAAAAGKHSSRFTEVDISLFHQERLQRLGFKIRKSTSTVMVEGSTQQLLFVYIYVEWPINQVCEGMDGHKKINEHCDACERDFREFTRKL